MNIFVIMIFVLAAMMGKSFNFRQLLVEMANLMRRNQLWCVMTLLLFAIIKGAAHFFTLAVAPKITWKFTNDMGALVTVLPIYVIGYFFITKLMQTKNQTEPDWSIYRLFCFLGVSTLVLSAGTVFVVLSIVPVINIFIRILLAIPILIVLIRCLMAPCFVVECGMAPVEALKASWSSTKGHGWTIFRTLLLMGIAIKAITLSLASLLGAGGVAGLGYGQAMIGMWDSVADLSGFCYFVAVYGLLFRSNVGRVAMNKR